MATATSKELRKSLIYELSVDKYGSFHEIHADLPRIKELGVDVVWFQPFYPKGIKDAFGSCYCIRNFREIDPAFGTLEDFRILVDRVHEYGMLCMIDIVFHHASKDSYLFENHPEFFLRGPDGLPMRKEEGWADIYDLDYSNKELWQEQIDVLKQWIGLGVDGFRCDVAPMMPMEFWEEARREVDKIKKNVIWLAESLLNFYALKYRKNGFITASDCETYRVFDMTYRYDVWPEFMDYLHGKIALEAYVEKIRMQEYIYPENYVKMSFIENHDTPRIKEFIPDERLLKIWTAFTYFQKGSVLLHMGQEAAHDLKTTEDSQVRLDLDVLNGSFSDYLKRLKTIKEMDIFAHGFYEVKKLSTLGVIFCTYEYKDRIIAGIFNVESKTGFIESGLKDGTYSDLIEGTAVEVIDGKIKLQGKAIIFEV
ncbi:alpha-amylase family glycosyl hydrolase [Paenibacillus montanisoli]|uniref:Alpha-amylase n=1 Tax=Paenibacillus montanisoli TaxID=2081970 RepID=A0A328U5U3_9BACL|nr:alpha-amylase family glycosyl hydrolase [Paenibacillus montanisoli]RAP77929.1 alpha-amylase [Paenibacillus montanisoli]